MAYSSDSSFKRLLFYCFFNLVVKASPSTKIFFLFIPAGNAKIRTTDKKTIKSNGNLPIPHSEKAIANVVKCIVIFSKAAKIYMIFTEFEYCLSKNYWGGLQVYTKSSPIVFLYLREYFAGSEKLTDQVWDD